MCILKRKIRLVNKGLPGGLLQLLDPLQFSDPSNHTNDNTPIIQNLINRHSKTKHTWNNKGNLEKTVFMDYVKATARFIVSNSSDPFFEIIPQALGINTALFKLYIHEEQKKLRSISSFKRWLIVQLEDPLPIRQYKALFLRMAEVFVKYHSIAWILRLKTKNKMEYLIFRNKFLRSVKNLSF